MLKNGLVNFRGFYKNFFHCLDYTIKGWREFLEYSKFYKLISLFYLFILLCHNCNACLSPVDYRSPFLLPVVSWHAPCDLCDLDEEFSQSASSACMWSPSPRFSPAFILKSNMLTNAWSTIYSIVSPTDTSIQDSPIAAPFYIILVCHLFNTLLERCHYRLVDHTVCLLVVYA